MRTLSIVRDALRLSSATQCILIKPLFVCILLVLSPGSTHAQLSQRFAPTVPTTYATGGANPDVIALTDMNGDGHPDLVVATTHGSSITISYLPGNGTGTFGAPKTAITLPATDTYPVATGDFNHDGHLDLVVMTSSNQVVLLLGDGYGTFHAQPPVSCPGCINFQVGTGDFNRDGELDLVFSASNNTLVVLPGIGNGKFKTSIVSNGFTDVGGGMVVGDFNRDGLLDVVTTDGEGNFETALGNGNGTFHIGPAFFGGGEAAGLSAADFRKDGKLDLVWIDFSFFSTNGDPLTTLFFARGNGDGSFEQPIGVTPGTLTDQALIGDFNGDGRPDILAVNAASDSISVLLSNSTGGFEPPLNFRTPATTPGLNAAFAGDANGDGKTDVVLSLNNGAGVLLAQSGGTFHAAHSLELFSSPVAAPSAPVDVNHDDIPDVLMITNENSDFLDGDNFEGVLPVLSSHGVALTAFGSFEPDNFINVYSIGVGNFNRDGNVGTAIIGDFGSPPPEDIAVSLNDGKGNFNTPPTSFPTTNASLLAVGDFNGDGLSDLALLVGNTVQIELGNGGESFHSPVSYAVGDDPAAIAVRDVNGDGRQDLVVVNKGSGTVSVLLGNGNGTFAAQKVFPVGEKPVAVAFEDFNRDGKVDLAVADENEVAVLLGEGNGSFGAAKDYAAATGLLSIAAADLRQNGLADIVAGASNGNLILLSGLGNGTFAPAQQYAAGGAWFIDVADFNGDGAPDVVVPGPQFSYAVSVLYNEGGTRVALTSSATTIVVGESVKLTAKVAASVQGAGSPTGTVEFYDGSKAIGVETLSQGTATLTTSKLSQGTHSIKAFYSGNAIFNTREFPTVTITVKP